MDPRNILGLPENPNDMPAHQLAYTVGSAVLKVTMMRAIRDKVGGQEVVHHLACMTVPGLHEIAIQTANHSGVEGMSKEEALEKYDPNKVTKPHNVLFAALLLARMAPDVGDRDKVHLEMSPVVVLQAMEDFEKLTGTKPDAILHPRMVEAAREQETTSVGLLQDFLNNKPSPETRAN